MGLRALSLRALGVCRRSLVLGAGPDERRTGLLARARRVHSVRPEPDWLGAARSRRRLRAALLQHVLAAAVFDARQSLSACCEPQRTGRSDDCECRRLHAWPRLEASAKG